MKEKQRETNRTRTKEIKQNSLSVPFISSFSRTTSSYRNTNKQQSFTKIQNMTVNPQKKQVLIFTSEQDTRCKREQKSCALCTFRCCLKIYFNRTLMDFIIGRDRRFCVFVHKERVYETRNQHWAWRVLLGPNERTNNSHTDTKRFQRAAEHSFCWWRDALQHFHLVLMTPEQRMAFQRFVSPKNTENYLERHARRIYSAVSIRIADSVSETNMPGSRGVSRQNQQRGKSDRFFLKKSRLILDPYIFMLTSFLFLITVQKIAALR